MPAQTYGDTWRRIALMVPAAPATLVQEWVQEAYNTLVGKGHWAWLRKETVLTTQAQRAVTTIVANQGSPTLTSAGEFLAEDVGRQIRVANGTIYTIGVVNDVNSVVLTQSYAEVTAVGQTMTIHDRYLVMPEDFRSIFDVTDMSIQRPIAWWITRDRLDLFDPGRISSDSRFRVLAGYQHSQVPSLLGRVAYEMWPQPTAVGSYQLRYYQRPDTLTDETEFQPPLATSTQVLKEGALAMAALWPGMEARKNPYFNLQLADRHQKKFEDLCQTLWVMNDDQYLQMEEQIDLSKFGLAALSADTTLLRSSDATLADYY